MITTPSGLQYEDTVAGSGDSARAGRQVRVHYTGWLHDAAAARIELAYGSGTASKRLVRDVARRRAWTAVAELRDTPLPRRLTHRQRADLRMRMFALGGVEAAIRD